MTASNPIDEPKGPISWMARNHVAANLLMIVLLVGGLFLGLNIKQEVFPSFDLDRVTVTVAYPGSSPEEVEQGIVLAVEQSLEGLEGVGEIYSTASEGAGTVTIEALTGADIDKLAQEVRNEVDRIGSFPEDAEDPTVEINARRREVLSIVLHGEASEKALRETAEQVRDGLLQEPGVTQVELEGIRDLEISIEIPQEKLRALNLTLEEVASRIQAASVEASGGGVKTGAGEILLRVKERRDWGREFARAPVISDPDGTIVRLEDIAEIKDGFEDSDYHASYNGRPAILIEVYRVGEQTPIEVSRAARNYIDSIREDLPEGISIDIRRDRSKVYKQRLELLVRNGAIGLTLVFILLAVFLETRLAFWVALGIPISFLGALLFLPSMGVSINMISMFAFIIALGIVVDDAIVVGENVYHFRQEGHGFMTAAIRGARQVSMPVTFSVLTNMVAFAPMAFVPGIMGKVFKTIPLVVITVFAMSLVESLFILPAHLGWQKQRRFWGPFRWLHDRQQGFSRLFTSMVGKIYSPFLAFCLNNRYVTVAVGAAMLLLIIGYVQSGRMGFTLMPRVESDYAFVEAQLPYGTAVEKSDAVSDILVASARKTADENGGDRLVHGIYAQVNGRTVRIRAFLTDADVRPIGTRKFIGLWRKNTPEILGLERLSLQSDRGGPGSGKAITVELSHRSLDVLEHAGEDLAATLDEFSSVNETDDGFSPGKRQMDFTMLPEGRAAGLTARDVARQVRSAFYGAQVLKQQRGRNEIKVMVRLPENERSSEHHIEELMLRTPGRGDMLLRQAVEFNRDRAYTSIRRRNGRRVITVEADVEKPEQATRVAGALKSRILPELMEKYPGLGFSFEGRRADMADSIESLMAGLGMALMVIFALLAIPLRSYVQPMIVMVSIPFGIVGAVIGHMIMGYSLSVMSMFGIVALSGVVVNDSLLLTDFANRARREGASSLQSVLEAGRQRFRPVLLTTLTPFGGLAPMIFETSRQARFMIPMAISLGFGIVFATVVTLILVPCFFIILEDIKKLLS